MIHKEIDFNIGITNSSVLIPLSRYRNNGMINNGARDRKEKAEKSSLLEKLQNKKEEAEQMQRQTVRETDDKVPAVTPEERTRG